MRIRSLLPGSAAAMAAAIATTGAATGTRAADMVVADEPAPVEHVRVCDAFGSGYFYIPGTETCLKFGGLVRMRVFGGSDRGRFTAFVDDAGAGDDEDGSTFAAASTGGDSYSTAVRGRLNIDLKSETELGELHARLRLQAENDGSPGTDAGFGMDQGYVQLGGLFAGYSESAWATTTNGGASGFGGKGIYDGSYGYQQRNMLQYQFDGENIFAAISLEDDDDDTSWTPDVVGRVGGVFGGVTAYGVVGYDQSADDGSGEFGVKLGLNADIGSDGNLIVQGFYASGNNDYRPGYTFLQADVSGADEDANWKNQTWTPEWSILAGYSHKLTPTLSAHVNGQYFSDFYENANSSLVRTADDADRSTGMDAWAVSGGFKWAPVDNFHVAVDAEYTSIDAAGYFGTLSDDSAALEEDFWRFVVELQRSF